MDNNLITEHDKIHLAYATWVAKMQRILDEYLNIQYKYTIDLFKENYIHRVSAEDFGIPVIYVDLSQEIAGAVLSSDEVQTIFINSNVNNAVLKKMILEYEFEHLLNDSEEYVVDSVQSVLKNYQGNAYYSFNDCYEDDCILPKNIDIPVERRHLFLKRVLQAFKEKIIDKSVAIYYLSCNEKDFNLLVKNFK